MTRKRDRSTSAEVPAVTAAAVKRARPNKVSTTVTTAVTTVDVDG
jgi:hypothetical protein